MKIAITSVVLYPYVLIKVNINHFGDNESNLIDNPARVWTKS